MKIHHTTVGEPTGEPVLILHGTTGSGAGMLTPTFGAELFGRGQTLDATKYDIILPDSIGTGQSSKPSDGLRMKFSQYNYDDAVRAQHRLLTEHLGIKHLRMVLGNSMGGMQTWIWARKYPGFMDIAVPMASLPTPMRTITCTNGIRRATTTRPRPPKNRRDAACDQLGRRRAQPA